MAMLEKLKTFWRELTAEDADPWDDEYDTDGEYWTERHSEWISLWSERPMYREHIIGLTERGEAYDLVYYGENPDNLWFGRQRILYWMPMPDYKSLPWIGKE